MPAHHHFVIAAARAVRVEVGRLHAARHQVLSGGAVLLDRAGRRDVIGRDAVAEQRERAGAADVLQRRRLQRDAFEERRVADVGGVRLPGEAIAGRHGSDCQRSSPPNTSAYCSRNICALTDRQHRFLDLALGRPEVAQIHRRAAAVGARAARSSGRCVMRPASAYATTSGGEAR